MCSILVFSKPDNIHPDPKEQWRKFDRGDVIAVEDRDDFFWGNDIQGPKALGWWRVIVLPGVSRKEIDGLMSPEVLTYAAPDDAPRKQRAMKIDLDAVEAAVQVKGVPPDKVSSITFTKMALLAQTQQKPATTADAIGKTG